MQEIENQNQQSFRRLVDEKMKAGLSIKEIAHQQRMTPQKVREKYHAEANKTPREAKKDDRLRSIQECILKYNCCPKILTVINELKFNNSSSYLHYIKRNTKKTHTQLCKFIKRGRSII